MYTFAVLAPRSATSLFSYQASQGTHLSPFQAQGAAGITGIAGLAVLADVLDQVAVPTLKRYIWVLALPIIYILPYHCAVEAIVTCATRGATVIDVAEAAAKAVSVAHIGEARVPKLRRAQIGRASGRALTGIEVALAKAVALAVIVLITHVWYPAGSYALIRGVGNSKLASVPYVAGNPVTLSVAHTFVAMSYFWNVAAPVPLVRSKYTVPYWIQASCVPTILVYLIVVHAPKVPTGLASCWYILCHVSYRQKEVAERSL